MITNLYKISEEKQNVSRFNRIFRAYRFASQLGFELERKTLKACRTNFETACKTISGQRILIEVEKMSKVK